VNETWTITKSDGELGVVVSSPDGEGPFPVIFFFHHGPGLDEGSKQSIQTLAEAGYYVVAPDRYWRYGPFLTFSPRELRSADTNPAVTKLFRTAIEGTTDAMVESDVQAILVHLGDYPEARRSPMGCIGFCIGARSVIRTMAAHPQLFTVGVALHPSFCVDDSDDSPHTDVVDLPGFLYVGIGAEDQMSSVETNRPLINAVAELGDRGKVDIHAGADHGFAVPGPSYHAVAASRSYDRALTLFAKGLA